MEEIAVNHKRVGSGQEAQVLALQTENERLKAEVAASELREATWAQKFDAARDGFAKRLYNVRKRHILKRRKLQSKYRAEVAALRTEMAVKDRDYINLCIHGQQEEKAMRDLSRQLQDACMENDSLKAEVAALRERWDTAMKEAESAAGHEFGLWPMGAAVAIAALREDKARFVRMAEDWSNAYLGVLVAWKGPDHVKKLMDDPDEFKSFKETREAIDAARKEQQ